MLKLIVLAQEAHAKRTVEYATTMFVHTSLTFDAHSIDQRTCARMTLKAFASVTDPGFAEIANRSNHAETGGEYANMFNYTVARFQHAFDFAALSTDRKALHTLTEIAESTRFLFSLTFVALQTKIKNGH